MSHNYMITGIQLLNPIKYSN